MPSFTGGKLKTLQGRVIVEPVRGLYGLTGSRAIPDHDGQFEVRERDIQAGSCRDGLDLAAHESYRLLEVPGVGELVIVIVEVQDLPWRREVFVNFRTLQIRPIPPSIAALGIGCDAVEEEGIDPAVVAWFREKVEEEARRRAPVFDPGDPNSYPAQYQREPTVWLNLDFAPVPPADVMTGALDRESERDRLERLIREGQVGLR